jgi:uncharacterized membrane protein
MQLIIIYISGAILMFIGLLIYYDNERVRAFWGGILWPVTITASLIVLIYEYLDTIDILSTIVLILAIVEIIHFKTYL